MKVLLLFTLMFMFSCSKATKSKTSFSLDVGSIVQNLQGMASYSAVIMGESNKGDYFNRVIKVEGNSPTPTDSITLDLPNGSWTFYALVWDRDTTPPSYYGDFSGTVTCAKSGVINLEGDDANIDLNLDTEVCKQFGKSNLSNTDDFISFYGTQFHSCNREGISILKDPSTEHPLEHVSGGFYCVNNYDEKKLYGGHALSMNIAIQDRDSFGGTTSTSNKLVSDCFDFKDNQVMQPQGSSNFSYNDRETYLYTSNLPFMYNIPLKYNFTQFFLTSTCNASFSNGIKKEQVISASLNFDKIFLKEDLSTAPSKLVIALPSTFDEICQMKNGVSGQRNIMGATELFAGDGTLSSPYVGCQSDMESSIGSLFSPGNDGAVLLPVGEDGSGKACEVSNTLIYDGANRKFSVAGTAISATQFTMYEEYGNICIYGQ